MCEKVGIIGKTIHSLRATGVTRLFEARVPETMIQRRSGHASADALHAYERPSVEQQRAVSRVISSIETFDCQSVAFADENSEQQCETGAMTTDAKRHYTMQEVVGALNLHSNQNCTININFGH